LLASALSREKAALLRGKRLRQQKDAIFRKKAAVFRKKTPSFSGGKPSTENTGFFFRQGRLPLRSTGHSAQHWRARGSF
jgi:hypothetical protein